MPILGRQEILCGKKGLPELCCIVKKAQADAGSKGQIPHHFNYEES